MAPNKVNVKERYTDGEIDLSMSDLQEVPVKEIIALRKATSLDISNNRLSVLPKNFSTLVNITKLDLSKNELKELPEDFGNLSRLKYLDLYQNQLQHLPLSFSKLKDLRFLDLKDNPLVPKVAKVAGPCLDTKQCQSCAKDIVNFFSRLEQQVNDEVQVRNKARQKQLEINNQKKQEEKKLKKKDKQKQKQEAGAVSAEHKSSNSKQKTTTKTENIKESVKINNKKPKSKFSFIKFCTVFILLPILILFVATSVNCKHTKHIENIIKDFYADKVAKLPPNLKEYGVKTGGYIKNLHEKTGNVTEIIVRKLNFSKVYDVSSYVFHISVEKIKGVYDNVVKTM